MSRANPLLAELKQVGERALAEPLAADKELRAAWRAVLAAKLTHHEKTASAVLEVPAIQPKSVFAAAEALVR